MERMTIQRMEHVGIVVDYGEHRHQYEPHRRFQPMETIVHDEGGGSQKARHSRNPNSAEVVRDCVTNGERSAAHSILARSLDSNKGRIQH